MNIDWQQVITALGGYTIFATALAWLAQAVIGHLLSKDIERFKAKLDDEAKLRQKELELQLKSQFDLALAKANSQLQIMAKENEIRFTKLHEKRADIISTFYSNLHSVIRENALLILRIKYDPSENHIKAARELWVECGKLSEYFRKNKL